MWDAPVPPKVGVTEVLNSQLSAAGITSSRLLPPWNDGEAASVSVTVLTDDDGTLTVYCWLKVTLGPEDIVGTPPMAMILSSVLVTVPVALMNSSRLSGSEADVVLKFRPETVPEPPGVQPAPAVTMRIL